MIDLNHLPDAWRIIYKLDGEEGNEKDGLYEIYYQISTAIFKYRLKHNLSQKKLAEKLGVTQAMVSKLESGDYNYTIGQLWKVSQKLGFKLNIELEEETEDITEDYIQKDNQIDVIHSIMVEGS
ncbi:MAG: helix-turn-helix transcriptional regulator [Bacillota bacterium]|nr:helix-turn-helix transcriptional regulator [Bacillota bacterium]